MKSGGRSEHGMITSQGEERKKRQGDALRKSEHGVRLTREDRNLESEIENGEPLKSWHIVIASRKQCSNKINPRKICMMDWKSKGLEFRR